MAQNVLLEREPALTAVADALDTAAGGHGATLFISGEAGLGKTEVLDRAVAEAQGGFAVGRGRGDSAETALPFGLARQALAQLTRRTEADDARTQAAITPAMYLYASLRGLQEAATRPLLVAIDDLHWSDPDSLSLLRFLVGRISGLPIAIVATLRPWPGDAMSAVQDLMASHGAVQVRLAPLSPKAAGRVLSQRAGHPLATADVERLHRLCHGNPLLLQHVDLSDSGTPGVDGPTATGRVEGGLLLDRFVGLTGPGWRLAEAAAVLGVRFQPEVACAMTGLDADTAAAGLEALHQTRLVRDLGAGWSEFVHALFRQALYDAMSGSARHRAHAVALGVGLALGVDPSEAAEHAIAAHLLGDAMSIDVLSRAGRSALREGAAAAAVRRLSAAVELAGAACPSALLIDLSDALSAAGDLPAAMRVLERGAADERATDAEAVAVLRRLARTLAMSGDAAAARHRFAAAEARATRAGIGTVDLLLDQAFLAWLHGPSYALPIARRARDLAVEEASSLQPIAESAVAYCAFLCGDPTELPVIEAAARAADMHVPADYREPWEWQWDPVLVYGYLARWVERFEESEQVGSMVYAYGHRHANPLAMGIAAAGMGDQSLRLGDVEGSLRYADELSGLVELAPSLSVYNVISHAATYLELGDSKATEDWCVRGDTFQPPIDVMRVSTDRIRAELQWREGDLDRACAAYRRVAAGAADCGLGDPCIMLWAADAIAAYGAAARHDDVEKLVQWLDISVALLPRTWPRIMGLHGRAALAEAAHDLDAAEAHFADARAAYATLPMEPSRVRTMLAYVEFLRRSDREPEARDAATEVLALAERLGMRWHADRAALELRRAGGRRRNRREGVLTLGEAEVARLARRGLSNAEIAAETGVSVRTVESHIAHIYRKLEISSRRELMSQKRRD